MTAAAARAARKKRRARTRLDPEVRREQILAAAEAVLAERDAGEVTFEQIAEAAGVSRGLVYNYFGDKGGLVAAVYLRRFEQLDDTLERMLRSERDPERRLRAIVDVYLQFAAENPNAWRMLGSSDATEHPVVRRARRDRIERISASWGDSAESRMVARGILGFLEAATLEWLDEADLPADRAAEVMHAQLWSGLGAGDGRTLELTSG
jgi:AcrR family transcriptional regulator